MFVGAEAGVGHYDHGYVAVGEGGGVLASRSSAYASWGGGRGWDEQPGPNVDVAAGWDFGGPEEDVSAVAVGAADDFHGARA